MSLKAGAAAALLILLIPILIGTALSGAISAVLGGSNSMACTPTNGSTSVAGYGPPQLANAATIVAVGARMNVLERGLLVALVTAMQESTLNNLDHGDRDSLGLFQQRPSQGWGTPAQIMDPSYAATQLYQHLLAIPNWQNMSINDAAQAVQRSGTPNAYARHESAARAVLAAVTNANCSTTQLVGTGNCNAIQAPNRAAMAAINYACGQRGLPYVWGGDGPNEGGFDCSGLTKAAYTAAGINLPRTAHTQYHAGPRVPAGQPLLPGDLVFYGPSTKVRHVGLYIGAGQMIHAPTFGERVRISPYRWNSDAYLGATRPAG